jgi:hypothetical protein
VIPYRGGYKRPMVSKAEHRRLFAITPPGSRAREHVRKKARRVAYNRLTPVSLRRTERLRR